VLDRGPDATREDVRDSMHAWIAQNWDRELELTEWRNRLVDAGWACPTWPEAWFGRDLPPWADEVVADEIGAAGAVSTPFGVGFGLAAPTLLAHGSEAMNRRLMRPTLTGTSTWCQLFSEPGSGSDLASLATRAVRDGDEWVVNGQKVWTSGAHYSDWGLLLARTNPEVPKHRGITAFLVDMRAPGIEVRPLRQITGVAHFNEVFLTDVRIPESCRVGGEGDGWRVANTMLSNERALIGGGGRVSFKEIAALARSCGATDDPIMRQALAQCYTRMQLIKWLGWRARSRKDQGLGPEASVLKLAASRRQEHDGDLVVALQQTAGMLYVDDAVDRGYWQNMFLAQWSSRLGGGTEQVQRNVIGERVLGLPSDVRVDKDVAFNEIPRG
jgi:alkylation response protein AidB-like acyl-CoA dehydrogenase